ncbi:aminotransferase class I/II-fold pyridoxal phosphate-dependent enzyme [Treponema pallidum]|nr:aminotransferase class I/II-fold pyridoxal phosphate-dependent enzyme [Treponema pallidum]ADD72363.1 putative aspartate aminotransferase TpAAT [Treponema pallidum subsp. pallidum str. Chicago]AEZ57346.1 pyridoxal phosphate-dependent aspartate aminotransferase [Treponema pallidum subsp. pertenue str. SamoaD]AEZ58415.1 pyridoxal phosphate-dependent aspartate aminotransferase [Treponema pallidum subsp. pertenue str. CDC2]AEZ59483.1 pyridoxal phosphate-dependent aspartate aminotransferase [Trepo
MDLSEGARALNAALEGTVVHALLSPLGLRAYFPHGIVAQNAEARMRAPDMNGAVGMVLRHGVPVLRDTLHALVPDLSSSEIVSYAPTAGIPALRERWARRLCARDPVLCPDEPDVAAMQSAAEQGEHSCAAVFPKMSLPIVLPGLTAALSCAMDLFVGAGQTVLVPAPRWENYDLMLAVRCAATPVPFSLFRAGRFDLSACKEALDAQASDGVIRLILNFPHNPSGYTPTEEEAQQLYEVVYAYADAGCAVLVICDDAYSGFEYEASLMRGSFFARFAQAHKNICALKIDGLTKEEYAWGLRVGFLSCAGLALGVSQYQAFEKKVMGMIRASLSCTATLTQTLALRLLAEEDEPAGLGSATARERHQFFQLMCARYREVQRVVRDLTWSTTECGAAVPLRVEFLPCNSGYFTCIRCIGFSAETLRQYLLEQCGIGTVAIDEQHLRVAFSALELPAIERVLRAVVHTAVQLSCVGEGSRS